MKTESTELQSPSAAVAPVEKQVRATVDEALSPLLAWRRAAEARLSWIEGEIQALRAKA